MVDLIFGAGKILYHRFYQMVDLMVDILPCLPDLIHILSMD
jgi:hypothetical protein